MRNKLKLGLSVENQYCPKGSIAQKPPRILAYVGPSPKLFSKILKFSNFSNFSNSQNSQNSAVFKEN